VKHVNECLTAAGICGICHVSGVMGMGFATRITVPHSTAAMSTRYDALFVPPVEYVSYPSVCDRLFVLRFSPLSIYTSEAIH